MGEPGAMASGVSHGNDLSLPALPVDDELNVQFPAGQEDIPGQLSQGGPGGTLPDGGGNPSIVAEVEDCLSPKLLHLPGGVEGVQDEDRM